MNGINAISHIYALREADARREQRRWAQSQPDGVVFQDVTGDLVVRARTADRVPLDFDTLQRILV